MNRQVNQVRVQEIGIHRLEDPITGDVIEPYLGAVLIKARPCSDVIGNEEGIFI